MRLTIEEYWNKVTPDPSQPFGTRVLPEYELKSRLSWPNSGYSSRSEWKARARNLGGFVGFDDQGRAKFDRGRAYGIHHYQIVSLTD